MSAAKVGPGVSPGIVNVHLSHLQSRLISVGWTDSCNPPVITPSVTLWQHVVPNSPLCTSSSERELRARRCISVFWFSPFKRRDSLGCSNFASTYHLKQNGRSYEYNLLFLGNLGWTEIRTKSEDLIDAQWLILLIMDLTVFHVFFLMFHYLCDCAAITNKKSSLLTCESASHLRSLHSELLRTASPRGADEAVNSSGSSCYIFTSKRLY